MGLKVIFHELMPKCQEFDKIRPKWDWKWAAIEYVSSIIAAIKSDQNGIESSKH